MMVRESSLKSLLQVSTFVVLAFLAGCSSKAPLPLVPEVAPEVQRQQLWLEHRQQIQSVEKWAFTGRLGLRVPKRSGSMSIEWLQDSHQYSIYLDGPFGVSVAHIEGDERYASARVSDGKRVVGRTPEHLMYQLTGWDLPVSSLKYWVRGLPAPGDDLRVSLNNNGMPETLSQHGWNIEYLRFDNENGVTIPSRIRASNGDIHITLVVSDWQLQ